MLLGFKCADASIPCHFGWYGLHSFNLDVIGFTSHLPPIQQFTS